MVGDGDHRQQRQQHIQYSDSNGEYSLSLTSKSQNVFSCVEDDDVVVVFILPSSSGFPSVMFLFSIFWCNIVKLLLLLLTLLPRLLLLLRLLILYLLKLLLLKSLLLLRLLLRLPLLKSPCPKVLLIRR